ncbi:hypothetical protein JCM10450v2_004937 [Rhodotorula kratochvilovae]
MVKLDTLPPPVLLHLVRSFAREDHDEPNSGVFFEIHDRDTVPLTDELFALASCNKALRNTLLPSLFRHITLSEPAVTQAYADKLKGFAAGSEAALGCARHLDVGHLLPEGIRQLNNCLRRMTSLEAVGWYSKVPIAPLLVETLKTLPHFHRLEFSASGTESLPYILPLAGKIDHLEVDTELVKPYPLKSLELAPLTVAAARRTRRGAGDKSMPTVQEQRDALVKGLSAFLLRAKEHLEYLDIVGAGVTTSTEVPGVTRTWPLLGDDEVVVVDSGNWLQRLFDAMVDDNRQYPIFPALKRLRIRNAEFKCIALKHLLKTSADQLTHFELVGMNDKELPAPPRPLAKLKHFYYLFADDLSCKPLARSIIAHSPLHTLVLSGMRPAELGALFTGACACSSTLKRVHLVAFVGGLLRVRDVRSMATACPEIEELLVQSVWGGEAIDFLDALAPLKKLRKFTFDHPWEKPRASPFREPDGRTIRSARNGDFRIMSVVGKSVEQEIRDRILADMKAVKGVYAKRFGAFAHRHPLLEKVVWHCSQETKWIWYFTRKLDASAPAGYKLVYRQVPDIEYAKGAQQGEPVGQPGVYFCTPGPSSS